MSKTVVKSLWIGPNLSTLEILSIKSFLKCGHRMHLYTYHPIENIPKDKDLIIKDGNTIIKYEELINLKSFQLPFPIYLGIKCYMKRRILGRFRYDCL